MLSTYFTSIARFSFPSVGLALYSSRFDAFVQHISRLMCVPSVFDFLFFISCDDFPRFRCFRWEVVFVVCCVCRCPQGQGGDDTAVM